MSIRYCISEVFMLDCTNNCAIFSWLVPKTPPSLVTTRPTSRPRMAMVMRTSRRVKPRTWAREPAGTGRTGRDAGVSVGSNDGERMAGGYDARTRWVVEMCGAREDAPIRGRLRPSGGRGQGLAFHHHSPSPSSCAKAKDLCCFRHAI